MSGAEADGQSESGLLSEAEGRRAPDSCAPSWYASHPAVRVPIDVVMQTTSTMQPEQAAVGQTDSSTSEHSVHTAEPDNAEALLQQAMAKIDSMAEEWRRAIEGIVVEGLDELAAQTRQVA